MKTKLALILACAALLLGGCGGLTKGKPAAQSAIDHFHQLYGEGKLEEIWNDATGKFRSSLKKEKFDELMSAVQRKLGKVTSTSTTTWRVATFNFTTTVKMTQKTVFEKGEGTESFVFEMEGEKAVLVRYDIQSMDLITK